MCLHRPLLSEIPLQREHPSFHYSARCWPMAEACLPRSTDSSPKSISCLPHPISNATENIGWLIPFGQVFESGSRSLGSFAALAKPCQSSGTRIGIPARHPSKGGMAAEPHPDTPGSGTLGTGRFLFCYATGHTTLYRPVHRTVGFPNCRCLLACFDSNKKKTVPKQAGTSPAALPEKRAGIGA